MPVCCRALASVSCGIAFVALLCNTKAPVPICAGHELGSPMKHARGSQPMPPACRPSKASSPAQWGLKRERRGRGLLSVRLNFFHVALWPPARNGFTISGLTGGQLARLDSISSAAFVIDYLGYFTGCLLLEGTSPRADFPYFSYLVHVGSGWRKLLPLRLCADVQSHSCTHCFLSRPSPCSPEMDGPGG